MPTLRVTNGHTQPLDGLGRNRPFGALSEKRVTKVTREALRARYGVPQVEVSCDAIFNGSVWEGKCAIGGHPFKYHILPS